MTPIKMTGGEAIAIYMKSQGIPFATGIPGHGCLGLTDAFKKHDIPVIQIRHEQSAAHLADGFYRSIGKPLVVFTSIGPGGCNTAIGVATAFVDSTAMIVITGSVHVRWYGHGVLQEIERTHWADFASILKPIVKRSYQVTSLEQLPWVLHNAFKTAMTGRPGPVHIDLPMDIQSASAEMELFEDPPFDSVVPSSFANPDLIEQSVDLLANAESPVILAGGGVLRAGATSELVTLAETLAIPVVTTLSGKGAFPEDHPLFGYYPGTKGSPIGNDLTTTSDVILALGCRFADETTSSYEQGISFNIPPTKLIQVDIDSGELGKNYTPEISILADARAFLNQVLVRVGDLGLSRDYRGSDIVTKLQIARDEWMADLLKQREGTPMTISRLLHEIRTAIPRDAFLVTSAGHTQAAAFQEFPILEPNTHISSGGFSTMGFGLPAALGVKLAHPERKVISLEGDGSFLMTCQELATAVQYDIPIVVVIADNQGWISIRDLQIDAYGNDRIYATEFLRKSDNSPYSPDFVKLAKSFGCKSNQANSPSELQTSMSQALNDNQPWVIVTTVERTHPRSESPVYGYWDVPKPDYLE